MAEPTSRNPLAELAVYALLPLLVLGGILAGLIASGVIGSAGSGGADSGGDRKRAMSAVVSLRGR